MLHRPIEGADAVPVLRPGEAWHCHGCDARLDAARDFCPACDALMPCYPWDGVTPPALSPEAEAERQRIVARWLAPT